MAVSGCSDPWLPSPTAEAIHAATAVPLCPACPRPSCSIEAWHSPTTHLLCDGLPSLLPCKVCRAWCNRQSLSMGLCCVDGGEGHFAQSPHF